MTVHGAYMDCLTTYQMPDPTPADENWSTPRIQRSRWLDLFDKADQLEVFQGLWGLMTYLTRQPDFDESTNM